MYNTETKTTGHSSKKKQNNNKSGLKALRKEHRRQDAYDRQARNVAKLEKQIYKTPPTPDDVSLLHKLEKAKKTLREIVGKTPLRTSPLPAVSILPQPTVEEKIVEKIRKKMKKVSAETDLIAVV